MTRATGGELVRAGELMAAMGWKPLTEEDLVKRSEAFRRGYLGLPEHDEDDGADFDPWEAA